jgi:nucleotide-binding universal stress UspA family protein
MTTVLAGIDESAATLPVLEAARRLAAVLGAQVEAVHVQENGSGRTAAEIAVSASVPLRVRAGDVVAALASEVRERDAVALVIGTRALSGGPYPAGHVALDLVQSLDCAIVVVPPTAKDRPVRRILVAVEGDGESRTLRGVFDWIGERSSPEMVALHVVEPHDLPMFADSPILEAEAFGREFLIQTAGAIASDTSRLRLETRVGDAPRALRDAVGELDADLVVLAWHRDLSGGHGRLVREMLGEATVPVVLLPRQCRRSNAPVRS